MATIDFFDDTDTLRRYAQGIEASVKLENLISASIQGKKKLMDLLGVATYIQLLGYVNLPDPDPMSLIMEQGIEYIRGAFANMIAEKYFIFEASQRNNTSQNLYRYQEEKIVESYIDDAANHLDNLIFHLNAYPAHYEAWANSRTFKTREGLFIKSANDFNELFNINNSAYFFQNIIYIIKEVQIDFLESSIAGFPLAVPNNDTIKYNIGKTIAFETISRACFRLDYSELPRGIRNDIYRELSAQKSQQESHVKEKQRDYYHVEALKYLNRISFDKASGHTSLNITVEEVNNEDNKFFVGGV